MFVPLNRDHFMELYEMNKQKTYCPYCLFLPFFTKLTTSVSMCLCYSVALYLRTSQRVHNCETIVQLYNFVFSDSVCQDTILTLICQLVLYCACTMNYDIYIYTMNIDNVGPNHL